jgi:uncharacterized protein YijF (DUF1287 family)
LASAASLVAGGCGASTASQVATKQDAEAARPEGGSAERRSSGSPFLDRFVEAAIERTTQKVRYDPAYVVIPYPGGDVPAETGVCTDEVIRAYRKVGIDLQKDVHEDMARNFRLYPKTWGLARPDRNIDHRRVPNLMVFFGRKGERLPVTREARDYGPGDIVTWDLGGGLTHIGIVVNVASSSDADRMMIVHNIGAGPQLEDVLFNWKITGHYRYYGTEGKR